MFGQHWQQLIKALQCLPHVGPKSAQRMAHHLLTRERDRAQILTSALANALAHLQRCTLCCTLCEGEICTICADEHRLRDKLCIVQSPMDLMVIEQTQRWEGLYFVLGGALSPLEGIGVHEIYLPQLQKRLFQESAHPIREVVLATNFNNEGETTAYAIAELLQKSNIKITRLAYGIPLGGELEYLDLGTIAQALISRREY